MKRVFLMVAAAASALALTVSCNKNNPVTDPIEENVVGTYSGLLNVKMNSASIVTDLEKDIKIELSDNVADAVDLVVEDLTLKIFGSEMSLGTISVVDCPVTVEGSTYSFASTEPQTITLPGELGSCTATVEGSVTDGAIDVDLTITWSVFTISVTFEGNAVSAE